MNIPEAVNPENVASDRSESAILTFSESTPVSLATLKQDGIQLDRGEAIAISQAVCLALITAQERRGTHVGSDPASAGPPLTTETVLIDPGSRLGVSVDDPGNEAAAIQFVGRVLADIVPGNARRSLETKIISKALASPPQFGILRELSQAIARYEQPKGRELIQAVYERWKKGEVGRPKSTIRLGSHVQAVAAAVCALAVVVMGVSGWLLMSRVDPEASIPAPEETSAPKETSSRVEATPLIYARPIAPMRGRLVTWSVAVADRPAPSPPAPSAPARVSHAAPRLRTVVPPAVARTARTERVAIDSPLAAIQTDLATRTPQLEQGAEVDAMSVRRTSDVTRIDDDVTTAISRPATEPVSHAGADSNMSAKPVTYTVVDANVSPPIPILPRLLASLEPASPGVRVDALAIAVVVDENGRAYSVKGLNAPQNMGEFVLLTSALAVVKSWEFRPALKDGAPVRYRLLVPLRDLTRSAQ